jgi:hypothetical protein
MEYSITLPAVPKSVLEKKSVLDDNNTSLNKNADYSSPKSVLDNKEIENKDTKDYNKQEKTRIGAQVRKDLVEKAKDVVFWHSEITIGDLITEGLLLVLSSYDVPSRTGPLKRGRKLNRKNT